MKTRNIHDEIEQWMAGALCDGLSVEEQTFFERHLAECEACRALYQEEKQMSQLLENEMTKSRPEPEFGERMVSQFRKRVAKSERGPGRVWTLGRLAWSRPMQVAYAVLLLAGMVGTGSLLTGGVGLNAAARLSPERQAAIFGDTSAPRNAPPTALFGLSGANTYSGSVTRSAGQIQMGNAPALVMLGTGSVAKGLNHLGGGYDYAPNPNNVAFAQHRAMSLAKTAAPPVDGESINGTMLADTGKSTAAGVPAPMPAPADLPMVPAATTAPAPGGQAESTAPPTEDQRKLIRNASVQYEVTDYTQATDTLTSIINSVQGYIATQNSDRGANGKLEGTIEVKVPPQSLDAFLLKLRVLGDLKGQNISTEDVTKDYFDTEARMHNGQMEEQRLQQILATKTGRLSDVLEVERELARVRQNIEEMQGTLKYYNTMIQYATVTISLAEKDMNAAAQFLLKQRDDLAVFATNVEATFAKAKQIATNAKAQVVDSNLNRDPDGTTTATLNLLIDPQAAEPTVDQLKGLGRIQTFTSHTERVAQDGTNATIPARTEPDKVEVHLTVQQDQENAVQQANVSLTAKDVEAKLNDLKTKATGLGAQVKGASFQQDPSGSSSATVQLRMTLGSYPAVLAMVKDLGEVKNLSVNRQEGATVNDGAPAEMTVQIESPQQIVTADNGVWATIRETLGQAFGAVMWSLRMIGVSLAFFGPWALAIAVVVWLVKAIRRLRQKSD